MNKGGILNVRAKYKTIINSDSTGDIVAAVVIGVECIVASFVILVNILN